MVGLRFSLTVLCPSGMRIRIPLGNRNPLRWATGKDEGEETSCRGKGAGKVPSPGWAQGSGDAVLAQAGARRSTHLSHPPHVHTYDWLDPSSSPAYWDPDDAVHRGQPAGPEQGLEWGRQRQTAQQRTFPWGQLP